MDGGGRSLGVGAPLPPDPSNAASATMTATVKSLTADERLRKKLFGKRAVNHRSLGVQADNAKSSRTKLGLSSMLAHDMDDLDDDNDGGRSSLGKPKRPRPAVPDQIGVVGDDGDGNHAAGTAAGGENEHSPDTNMSKDEPIRSSKRPSTFLDVILTEKSRKRRRKRGRKSRDKNDRGAAA